MLVENGVVNINERDDKGSTPAHKGLFTLYVISELSPPGNNVMINECFRVF